MDTNREPRKQPENVSPASTDSRLGSAGIPIQEDVDYDEDGNLSHIQSESHTDPAIPTPGEAESTSTSRAVARARPR